MVFFGHGKFAPIAGSGVKGAFFSVQSGPIDAAKALGERFSAALFVGNLLFELGDIRARSLRLGAVAQKRVDVIEREECRQQRHEHYGGVDRPVIAEWPRGEVEMDRLHPVNTPVAAVSSASYALVSPDACSATSRRATFTTGA